MRRRPSDQTSGPRPGRGANSRRRTRADSLRRCDRSHRACLWSCARARPTRRPHWHSRGSSGAGPAARWRPELRYTQQKSSPLATAGQVRCDERDRGLTVHQVAARRGMRPPRLRDRWRRNPASHAPSSDTCSAFVRSISVATPTSLLSAERVHDRTRRSQPRSRRCTTRAGSCHLASPSPSGTPAPARGCGSSGVRQNPRSCGRSGPPEGAVAPRFDGSGAAAES